MNEIKVTLLLSVLSLFALSNVLCQFAGDGCVHRTQNGQGVCILLRNCPGAIADLRRGIRPQVCSYEGTVPVVCCVQSPPPPPPTAATTRRTTTSNVCPPIPTTAVSVQKRGQKAWDKCIDLAESVYPCRPSNPILLFSPMVRTSICLHPATPLIVGGKPAERGEFPHMALLGFGDEPQIQWACGGSLISNKWVLTAGHCIYSREGGDVQHVRLGGDDVNVTPDPRYVFRVAKIEPHPEYIGNSVYNDIALLELDRVVSFTEVVRPACLHTGETLNSNKYVASGWGDTASRGNRSNALLKVTLESFTFEECSAANPKSRKSKDGVRDATQICAGHHTEFKDTCQGDSGGPLMVNNLGVDCTYLIVGVVSNGKVCGTPGIPAIYTRVSAYVPWIESIVWP